MNIASLLIQYLISHKRLDLTGIGTFILNQPDNTDSEHHRHDKKTSLEDVSFESNVSIKQNPELVQFIADQTGKIKAWAAADLESYLSQARQFLNIGNPFLFEGIGLLEKRSSGEYVLKQEPGIPERSKNSLARENAETHDPVKSTHDFKKILYYDKIKTKWRKPVAAILIIAGLALAVWAGYTIYKRTSAKHSSNKEEKMDEPVQAHDSNINQKDSILLSAQNATAGMQKFILEVCNAKRAFERFGRLKTFLWNVQMETKDSVIYKLFLVLPSSAADSSRIIDSLTSLNGRKVYIE